MCKSKTSVKYFTKVTQSLISPYFVDILLSQKIKSFPSTNQTSSLRSTPRCHSSPAIDPLIGTTHRHHSSPIASPSPSAPPTDSPTWVFFFFFSFRHPSLSSAPLFLGHLHRHWFILLILVLDFFFLYYCVALSI